jgi:hypothetical protein
MKKILFFTFFLILFTFSTHQSVIAEIEGEENREEAVKEATDTLKRTNTIEDVENTVKEQKEEEKIKQKLSKLKKFIPSEKELDEITLRTVWKYVDKQSYFNDEKSIETIQGLLRDVGRVYDPIFNKYKVATIQLEIIKYSNQTNLEDYWVNEKNSNLNYMFDNAYLVGSPIDNTKCFFNYTTEGAITICKTEEHVIQSIIFDKYQEHFMYTKSKTGEEKLELNQHEITTKIVESILKKINKNDGTKYEFELYKNLESNREIKEREHNQNKVPEDKEKKQSKIIDIEKNKKYGVQNVSCIKDEFGLITISGQLNNNHIKKNKISLDVAFLDYEQNIILKNTANLLKINEFETKRFIGNLKMDENFATCTIKIKN